MINDKSLENRLNAIKTGAPVPIPINPELSWAPQASGTKPKITLTQELLIDIYKSIGKTSGILITSLFYGFGIEAILGLEWEVLQTLGVGFIFNHTLTIFSLITKKLFSKKEV